MPDLVVLGSAVVAAAVMAALVVVLGSRPWRSPRPAGAPASSVLGMGLGFYVGYWILGVRAHWPPTEVQDRLLFVLMPAVILGELLAAIPGRIRQLSWVVRVGVAAGATRILIHNSSWITDLTGPGSREWSPEQMWIILSGLTATLGLVWMSLGLLSQRPAGRSVPVVVALMAVGVAGAVMLSGYATGGILGLPLAAGLVGVTLASLVLRTPSALSGATGVGVVGLFGLLVAGRFFGSLPTVPALLLFLAPLLCWLTELPPRFRGVARVGVAAIPIGIALVLTVQNFIRESSPPSAETKASKPKANVIEPTLQDYLDFGK
jgi:hypothetical protein